MTEVLNKTILIYTLLLIIMSGIGIGFIVLNSIQDDKIWLANSTCEQLFEKISNTKYGIEYHNEWIKKECWK